MEAFREDVLVAIEEERDYQESLGPNRRSPGSKSTGEYLTLLQRYVERARERWCGRAGDLAALHEIRKLAALAVACLEQNSCPRRGDPGDV